MKVASLNMNVDVNENSELSYFTFEFLFSYGKNSFAEVSINLAEHEDLKIILLDHQNNYVRRSSLMINTAEVLTF